MVILIDWSFYSCRDSLLFGYFYMGLLGALVETVWLPSLFDHRDDNIPLSNFLSTDTRVFH